MDAAVEISRPVRVVGWNVLADVYLKPDRYPHLDPLPTSEFRLEQIAAHVEQLADSADVVGLLECEFHVSDAVTSLLADGWKTAWVRADRRIDGTFMAVREHLEPVFCPVRVPAGRFAAVTAQLNVGCSVAAVHLTWSAPASLQRPAMEQVWNVHRNVAGPAVVFGDFNDSDDGDTFSDLRWAGFTTAEPGCPTAVVNGKDQTAVDAFAYRGVGLSEVCVTQPVSGVLPTAEFPSDHVPVAATIFAPGR